MNRRSLFFACFSIFLNVSSAQSAILFSTSLNDWQVDMRSTFSRQLDHQTFTTTWENIAPTVVGGFPALPDPADPEYEAKRMDWGFGGNNVDLGKTAVFDQTNTGFQWSFKISAMETDTVTSSAKHDHGTQYNIGDRVEAHIFFNDRVNRNNFAQVDAFTNVLSIGKHKGFDTGQVPAGDPYNWDNDDFNIEITGGPALYAFAFEIVNNKKYVDTTFNGGASDGGLYSYGRESLTIRDKEGHEFSISDKIGELPVIPGYFNDPSTPGDEGKYSDNFDDVRFIGIVSDTPITFLEFNEDSRSDDIGIRNLRFATNASPVPLPSPLLLLLSALGILSRVTMKNQ